MGEKHRSIVYFVPRFLKKRRLGPQNGSGSSGPKKLLKIVNYAETEKLKEAMVGSKWNRWVDTNIHLDQTSL